MTDPLARIRVAMAEDARSIAGVHVTSWQETYADIIPIEILAALSVDERMATWQRIIGDPSAGTKVYAAECNSVVVGFGSCCAQRSQELAGLGFDAEISAVYILKSSQGQGVGTALMRIMASALIREDFRAMSLWVLRENKTACRFYEKLGGDIVSTREDHCSFGVLNEVAYGWSNLDHLAQQQ